MYREVIAVCSEIQKKHINSLSGQNIELLNVKLPGIYCYHCVLILILFSRFYNITIRLFYMRH